MNNSGLRNSRVFRGWGTRRTALLRSHTRTHTIVNAADAALSGGNQSTVINYATTGPAFSNVATQSLYAGRSSYVSKSKDASLPCAKSCHGSG